MTDVERGQAVQVPELALDDDQIEVINNPVHDDAPNHLMQLTENAAIREQWAKTVFVWTATYSSLILGTILAGCILRYGSIYIILIPAAALTFLVVYLAATFARYISVDLSNPTGLLRWAIILWVLLFSGSFLCFLIWRHLLVVILLGFASELYLLYILAIDIQRVYGGHLELDEDLLDEEFTARSITLLTFFLMGIFIIHFGILDVFMQLYLK